MYNGAIVDLANWESTMRANLTKQERDRCARLFNELSRVVDETEEEAGEHPEDDPVLALALLALRAAVYGAPFKVHRSDEKMIGYVPLNKPNHKYQDVHDYLESLL